VAIERSTGAAVTMVWPPGDALPDGLDLSVLPGGFSYGDYLRAGAMAALSPVVAAVRAAAKRGVPVAGVLHRLSDPLPKRGCLPGALLRKRGAEIRLQAVVLELTNLQTRFTAALATSARRG